MPTRSSTAWAADTELFEVWDPKVAFPAFDEMPDLDIVTHVAVERAQPGEYHYLHEPAIAWHRDLLQVCFANHPVAETNVRDEVIRGRRSVDGLRWSEASIWAEAPLGDVESYNHPVLFEDEGRLLGFFTGWRNERPHTQLFMFDDDRQEWQHLGKKITGFIPFCPPQRLADGNWIMGGELFWYEAAVAISHGDDLTQWDTVQLPRSEGVELIFPETAIVQQPERLVAVCRPKDHETALASESRDNGRTWTALRPSNFPMAASKPFAGKLSTGQHYLMTCNLEEGRCLLSIAVTRPEGGPFCRVWKLRHQQYPKVRVFGGWGDGSRVGKPTEWSYPAAVEREGKLYIAYTQGKEDCALSVVPVEVLAV